MHKILGRQNIKSLFLSSILIFLVTIYFVYFYLHLNFNIISNDYAFKELFINYEAGLIRRGLLGQIFWILNNSFSIKPIIFFSYLFLLLYVAQIYLYGKLIKNYVDSTYIILLILLSPALILFNIYDQNVYFVKDIFIKLSVLLHAYILVLHFEEKKKQKDYFSILKFLIIPLLAILILIHEYQVIFLSVHYLLSLSVVKNKKNIFNINKIYSILIVPILFVLIFVGDQTYYENLNQILGKFNVEIHRQMGGGFYDALGGFYKWHFFYFSYRDFINLFFSLILSILIFYVLFQYLVRENIIKFFSSYQQNYILYFVPTLLCFILAVDHGRNISLISVHLISFYLTLSLNKKKFYLFSQKINKLFLTRNTIILFLFFYIFMWKLNQMAGFGLRGVPNDIFQNSLFSEVIKFSKFVYNFIDLYLLDLPEIKVK